jgi:hypothetical protein
MKPCPCTNDQGPIPFCDKCGGSGEIQDNSKAALKKEAAEPIDVALDAAEEEAKTWCRLMARMTERK